MREAAGGGEDHGVVSHAVPAETWRGRRGRRKRQRAILIRRLHTTVDLVAAIFAVGVPVTPPLLVDAFARAALGLTGRALGVHHWLAAALLQGLIRLVGAVGIVVTHPAEGDARGGAALEFMGAARRGCAVQLVAAITTVILAVADKVPGDAAAAGASELIGATRDVACGETVGWAEPVSDFPDSGPTTYHAGSRITNPSFPASLKSQCGSLSISKFLEYLASSLSMYEMQGRLNKNRNKGPRKELRILS